MRSDWAELSKYVKIKAVRTVPRFGNTFLLGEVLKWRKIKRSLKLCIRIQAIKRHRNTARKKYTVQLNLDQNSSSNVSCGVIGAGLIDGASVNTVRDWIKPTGGKVLLQGIPAGNKSFAMGPITTTGTGNEKRRTLRKSIGYQSINQSIIYPRYRLRAQVLVQNTNAQLLVAADKEL